MKRSAMRDGARGVGFLTLLMAGCGADGMVEMLPGWAGLGVLAGMVLAGGALVLWGERA